MKSGIMDEGWEKKIQKAIRDADKATAKIKPEKKADPKKKKAALDEALKQIEAAYSSEGKAKK